MKKAYVVSASEWGKCVTFNKEKATELMDYHNDLMKVNPSLYQREAYIESISIIEDDDKPSHKTKWTYRCRYYLDGVIGSPRYYCYHEFNFFSDGSMIFSEELDVEISPYGKEGSIGKALRNRDMDSYWIEVCGSNQEKCRKTFVDIIKEFTGLQENEIEIKREK